MQLTLAPLDAGLPFSTSVPSPSCWAGRGWRSLGAHRGRHPAGLRPPPGGAPGLRARAEPAAGSGGGRRGEPRGRGKWGVAGAGPGCTAWPGLGSPRGAAVPSVRAGSPLAGPAAAAIASRWGAVLCLRGCSAKAGERPESGVRVCACVCVPASLQCARRPWGFITAGVNAFPPEIGGHCPLEKVGRLLCVTSGSGHVGKARRQAQSDGRDLR